MQTGENSIIELKLLYFIIATHMHSALVYSKMKVKWKLS